MSPLGARDRLRMWRDEPLKRVAAEAALLRPLRSRQFCSFGERSILHRPLWLYGTRHAAVGDHCLLMHGAWLSVERSAWDDPQPALRIGNRVTLRPFVSISASVSIVLEDGVSIGTGSGIYDSNHVVRHDASVLDAGTSTYAPVHIGSGSWLGDRVTVLAGATIGAGCTIGAGSVVRGAIPAHSIAVGVPARIVGSNAQSG
jgi:acetyltransferase-like isoleucine patch superfamily enzyme